MPTGLKATVFAIFAVLVAGAGSAPAAELDCLVMADKIKPGDVYEFHLELQSQQIRLLKGDDFCTEAADKWFQRMLILPQSAPTQKKPPPDKKAATDEGAGAPASPQAEALPGQTLRQGPLPDLGIVSDQGSIAPITGISTRKNKQPKAQPLPGQTLREGPLPDLGIETDTGSMPVPTESTAAKNEREAAAAAAAAEAAATAAATQSAAEAAASGGPAAVHVTADGVVGADPSAAGQTTPGIGGAVFGVIAPQPPKKDDSLIKRCDRDISDFWQPGAHEIDGVKFWLSGVFTIDLDGDGRVDDVGFKIKSKGKIGNVLNYFPTTEGRLSGQTIKSLKLGNDSDIQRLCGDNVTFVEPGPEPVTKKAAPVAERKISGTVTAPAKEKEPEPAPEEPATPEDKMSVVIMWIGAIGVLFMVFGSVGIYFVLRRKTDDEDEDDEEEDEEDDDE
ncbi:MAG: hypothetical protein HQ504_11515 [Rhodospirillaceae bacterium]|nr:hypothetical protein [Rhodospirillaceae bacterium]